VLFSDSDDDLDQESDEVTNSATAADEIYAYSTTNFDFEGGNDASLAFWKSHHTRYLVFSYKYKWAYHAVYLSCSIYSLNVFIDFQPENLGGLLRVYPRVGSGRKFDYGSGRVTIS